MARHLLYYMFCPLFPVANGTLFAQKKLRFMVKVMVVSYLSPIGLPRVLEYWRVLDSKNYSSNVLVLEYSFNYTSGRKFQFPVLVFQINDGRKKEMEGKAGRKGGENHTGTFFRPLRALVCGLQYSRSHAACITHFRY